MKTNRGGNDLDYVVDVDNIWNERSKHLPVSSIVFSSVGKKMFFSKFEDRESSFEDRVSSFETLKEFFEDLEQRFRGNDLILEFPKRVCCFDLRDFNRPPKRKQTLTAKKYVFPYEIHLTYQ